MMHLPLGPDVRSGCRRLRANPGLTAVAVLTLAVGVGANSAIFTFVNAVLLQPLPFRHPDELVEIGHVYATGGGFGGVSALSFLDYRDQNRCLADAAVSTPVSSNLEGRGEPERVSGLAVTDRFFSLLGVSPLVGRAFAPRDYGAGAEPVVLLSHGLWRRHFGSGGSSLGEHLDLSGKVYTVVGVMPPGFRFGPPAEFWRPLILPAFEISQPIRRSHEWLSMIGRLRPSTSLTGARADFSRIADQLRAAYPINYPAEAGWRIEVHRYSEDLVGGVRLPLLVLFGVVGVVLLIACINVASLLLASAESRRKEFAIRIALGGGTWDVLRPLLVEGALLASLGGALGLLLAAAAVELFGRMSGAWLPRGSEVALDAPVVLFTLGICAVTDLVFGLAPALQIVARSAQATLSATARGATDGKRGNALRSALVVAEIALSLPLLVGCVLLVGSLRNLMREDPGFKTQHRLTFDVALPGARYGDHTQMVAFYDRVVAGSRALPGVTATAVASSLPFHGGAFVNALIVEAHPLRPGQPDWTGELSAVSPDYFGAMGIPVLRGRSFQETDAAGSPGVVIVDLEFANRFFSGDALGHRLDFEGSPAHPAWREIVGVVGHVKQAGLEEATGTGRPQYYVPVAQGAGVGVQQMSIVVNSALAPEVLTPELRGVMHGVDPQLPIYNLTTTEELVRSSLANRRFVATLVGCFTGIALLLVASGVYALIAFAVRRQRRAIAIRLALGAQPRAVLQLFLRRSMVLAGTGIAAGVLLCLACARVLTGLLYGVAATSWPILTAAATILLCSSLAAAYLPAREALRANPVSVLRDE